MRHLPAKRAEHSFDVGELAFDGFPETRCVCVVGPEFDVRSRHEHFGLGERKLALRIEETVDVIAMQVRDDNNVNRIRVDSGGGEIGMELT